MKKKKIQEASCAVPAKSGCATLKLRQAQQVYNTQNAYKVRRTRKSRSYKYILRRQVCTQRSFFFFVLVYTYSESLQRAKREETSRDQMHASTCARALFLTIPRYIPIMFYRSDIAFFFLIVASVYFVCLSYLFFFFFALFARYCKVESNCWRIFSACAPIRFFIYFQKGRERMKDKYFPCITGLWKLIFNYTLKMRYMVCKIKENFHILI